MATRRTGRIFDSSKHPRGAKGRFTEKPDRKRVKVDQATLARAAQVLTKGSNRRIPKSTLDTAKTTLEAATRLKVPNTSVEDARRLFLSLPDRSPVAVHTGNKTGRKIRAPRPRPPVAEAELKFTKGSLDIAIGKAQYGFTQVSDKGFRYQVEHQGKSIVLNKHDRAYRLDGELVRGVPPQHQNIRQVNSDRLVRDLTQNLTHVRNYETKGIAPLVPTWQPTKHGVLPKDILGKAGYGRMEIHHVNQFATKDLGDIPRRLEAGQITLTQAKTESAQLLQKTDQVASGYAVKTAPKEQRYMVVLPGGAHNATSPLYEANHPKVVHPETGKLFRVGIPKSGDDAGSRQGFDTFRPRFWTEYYRRHSYIIQAELNRRVKAGLLTPAQVKVLWQDAIQGLDRDYRYALSLGKT